ncbi:LOW QUALITY PROTEIN: RPA-related protein RADX, partial [Dugong dugon]
QKVLEQVIDTLRQWVNFLEVVPVTVLAVQRYLLEDEPCDLVPRLPLCYDVTISDGVYQENCYLDPHLNSLVYKNILKVGKKVRISRVSCVYNEKRIGQGILCINKVHCGKSLDAISLETPFRNRTQEQKPERPLRGGKSHYLALWNNEDPYGDIWLINKETEEYNLRNARVISLSYLEMTWSNRSNFPALLVRILYKSKLYYGTADKKITEPYLTFLEVADNSGVVSVIMWNALCPEWMFGGRLVLLLQQHTIKRSYPFRMQHPPVDPHMKLISSVEICLNLQDPPTNINIIPESLKSGWRLLQLRHRFVTSSELDNLLVNHICDVTGILVFVGRVQWLKKKDKLLNLKVIKNSEDFWTYRWIHIADATSKQPFILELFTTSQPEIFENICPMTYFVCTHLKVVRNNVQVPKLLYLTTTNENQMFITGQRGQPYAYDIKVKKIIQWIKIKTNSGEMKNTVFGGYYHPPVPETFSKSSSVKVESLLTAISEVRKEIEDLQYREQKRIAIQGIITVVKYIPHSSATESASASETLRNANLPSTSQAARGESQSRERDEEGPSAKVIALSQPETSSQAKGYKPDMPSSVQRLNHEIAIDAAFLPMYCPEDADTLLSCMNHSCVFPPEATGNDRFLGPRAVSGDIRKAVTELNRAHIISISILDSCNLGDNKIEVCLQKIYTPENIY